MVGVPKSTGCLICRKRKIKCDETWPTCVNCQKNGKCCPGPPARHTFKDLGPRLSVNSVPVTGDDTSGAIEQQHKHLTQLNEKWSDSGAVFQKFRISDKEGRPRRASRSPRPSPSYSPPRSPFLRQPSPSQHQELGRALVNALHSGDVGHRMSAFGAFIREVPMRIGYNPALDAAVACLVHAHTTMVYRKENGEILHPGLYLRAVQSLQTCLDDPFEGMSSNTLCATLLLGLVEALAGPRADNRYLAHVGGAGRLMELQGPMQCEDSFAKEMLRFNRGGIIVTSIYQRRPCFLASPQWRDIAFDKSELSFDDCLYTDILEHMSSFPALLRELKDLEVATSEPLDSLLSSDFGLTINLDDSLPPIDPLFDLPSDIFTSTLDFSNNPYRPDTSGVYNPSKVSLLNKLHSLKQSLNALGVHLNAKLADNSAAVELPSIDEKSPVPTAFHFTNFRVTVAYNCFWSLQILTNKIIMELLPPYDSASYALEAECRSIACQICKTWEDAWASKPIGAFHTGLSFVTAYEFCTPEVQTWILQGLNALLEEQLVHKFRWSDEVVKMMSGKLIGEGPDLVYKRSRVPK